MMISSEEAVELIPLEQYVSLGYPGLGMIGTIRPEPESRDVGEWRPSSSEMETAGPTFVTGEIDVLDVTRALDHRIPLPIGHLLSISEQANERMMQHCKANRKRFALARAKDQKAKAPALEEKADVASDPIRVGLIQKDDHFLRIKPIPLKSAECDIKVWGVPYSAIIDSGAAVLAISLRVVDRAGRKSDLIMLTEKDQLVSADEEKIKTVGRMTNVAFQRKILVYEYRWPLCFLGNRIHCKPYRYSLTERKTALQRIREFETNGWIEPATGPWSFPVVLVPKKNGSVRICIDYRKLNDIAIKDVYPLPRIDDLLDAIGCANYFSKFDIRHGFHHILVKEEDWPKTAFVLFEGTWQWVRCPMGICNVPATFQRAMNVTFHNFVNKTRLTQGMINFCVIVYMDDILVYSDTFHRHAQHIEWTLGALRDAGFKIALEKGEFFLPKISFSGYVVTRGGLRPDSRKVTAVKEAPVPTSLTQVRAFLGVASYYRRFIKGFAAIARPLTNLLQKEQPLHWDDECDRAFGALKDALVTAPILIRPDPSRQFILITDWQPEAISAIVAQKGNDGKEHVIEYASRTLQEYEFDIVHRKTERHDNADGLTRLHRPESSERVDPAPGAPRRRDHTNPSDRIRRPSAGSTRPADAITHPHPLPSPMSSFPLSTFELPSSFPTFWQSDLHPRLSFCINPLAVPLLDPPQWDAWRRDFVELSLCLTEVRVTWTREERNYPRSERLELLLIQAWRTEVEGDLLGFLFGSVRLGCRRLLTQELTVSIAQLADDLDVSIVSQDDPRLVPHVTSRTLLPYLQWSACVEGFPSRIPPSRLDYLDPRDILDPAFYRPPYEDELEEIIREELAEESSEEEEENLNEDEGEPAQQREDEEDELPQVENEEEAEEEDSEQGSGDDNDEEHAAEEPQLEIVPVADLPISNDPTLDPELPQPDDGDVAQMAGPSACRPPSPLRRRRRSRSPSVSSSLATRPALRARRDETDRSSSSDSLSTPP
ncbi:hypothetical protein CBR_g19334 [Chara braunii]|uniref:Reverse transcriptase domain-containing protein n=1 Tax=Chara braunii TaxID=69332 RepID=A0A388KXW5_CHABU|nr:hypothetical protein CBR_g19334 [Chara braunii]|eukprot:GBG74822.1 hypothetical protein CBR_g19334 [Chara braunii]